MSDKLRQAVMESQQDVILAAEQKLGRPLTERELGGIRGIDSLMMLESCYRSFSSRDITAATVGADLEHFATKGQTE